MTQRYVLGLGADTISNTPAVTTREIAAPAADVVPVTVVDPPGGFWSQYGGEITVGVITAVVSAVATYFAMRAVQK